MTITTVPAKAVIDALPRGSIAGPLRGALGGMPRAAGLARLIAMSVPAEILPINVRPEPFSVYTTPEFWNDPHLSAQLLQAHLDPDSGPASRPHAFIERSVEWLLQALGLRPGSRVLDLGCGPGLYANRLAGHGMQVTGIDVSRSSLTYARTGAQQSGPAAEFIEGNYLEADLGSGYDAALLIYADVCALSFEQRRSFLQRVLSALLPGGLFAFDVPAAPRFTHYHEGIELLPADGFWAAGPHVATRATWTYPELRLVLERYVIQTPTKVREFWNWTHCLTAFEVEAELASAGFADFRRFGDVAGADYDPGADTFALIARRPG